MDDNELEEIRKKYVSDLYDDFRYSTEKFDSQALFISSGALAISLTFLKDIVPIKDTQYLFLFYISLILFGLSIVIGFIAHYKSSRLIMKRIKKIEKKEYDVKDDMWINWLNRIIITALVFGIGFLITFTIINMEILKSGYSQNQKKIEVTKPNNKCSCKQIECNK